MMAICHTAVPERTDGNITYQAASPGRSHFHRHSEWIYCTECCSVISPVHDVSVCQHNNLENKELNITRMANISSLWAFSCRLNIYHTVVVGH